MTYQDLILNILETIIVTIIFTKYFHINKNNYKIILSISLLLTILFFNTFTYFSILLPFVLAIIEISLTKFFCKNSIYEIVSVAFFEYLNFSCMGVIVLFFINSMNLYISFNAGFIVYPIHFLMCLLLVKLKDNYKITLPKIYWKYIAMLNVIFYFTVTYVVQLYFGKEAQQVDFLIISISIFFTALSLYAFVYKIYELAKEKINQDFQISKMKLEQQNEEYIQSINEQLHMIRHDLKHDYQLIQHYLDINEYEKIQDIIKVKKDDLSNLYSISCQNKVIESLINSKIIKANKYGKKLYCQISYAGKLKIKENHLYQILSNLIDNAIEYGCRKELYVKVDFDNMFLSIQVENSISSYVTFETKKDKDKHGYGLKNIEKIIHDYQGSIEKIQDNQTLNMRVIIPNL